MLGGRKGRPKSRERSMKSFIEETVFKICEHLAANPDRGITKTPHDNPFGATYGKVN